MAWENSLSCLAECNQAVVESAVEGLFSILLDRPGESREWARDFIFDYDSDSAGDTMALSNDAVAAYTSGSRVSVAGMRGNGEACELFSVQVRRLHYREATLTLCFFPRTPIETLKIFDKTERNRHNIECSQSSNLIFNAFLFWHRSPYGARMV